MGRVPLKFVHTITSRKSAELVIVIVDVAATSCLGHSVTPFTALGVNTDGNLRVCRGRRAGSVGRARWRPGGGRRVGGRWLASRRRLASCYFSFSQALTQTSNRSCRAE